jgi:hypothetical protein
MAKDLILKLFQKPESLNPDKLKPEDIELLEALLKGAEGIIGAHNAITQSIGGLALAWAALDSRVDELFEPLLECSEAQVTCILVENIGTRCEMVKKLLHVDPLPPQWVEWAEALLNRTSGELASLRNRCIHDSWRISAERATRTHKKARVGKAQSRQKRLLSLKTEHETSAEDIKHLTERIATVSIALHAAKKSLLLWRSQGKRPRVSKQWLPASKPGARMLNYQADAKALEKPLLRLRYEFDKLP